MIDPATLAAATLISMLIGSGLSFALLAWDKRAARLGRWRTKQTTLHVLELLGGWPGSLLASALLRHKSRKAGYRLVRIGCIVLHLTTVVAVWVFLRSGS